MVIASLLWALTLAHVVSQTCDYSQEGVRLADCPVPVVDAEPNKPINLHFQILTRSYPKRTITSRAYALENSGPSVPGPIIRTKRGSTLQITLHNDLVESVATTTEHVMNGFHSPDYTNLHLHGLHVASTSPGDDMSIVVKPKSSFAYKYDIPNSHAAGLHLYHNHHHGSVALQFGGGSVGQLVVIDDETNSPFKFLSSIDSTTLFIMRMQPSEVVAFAKSSNDPVYKIVGDISPFVLVNGFVNPVLTLPSNRWHRLRLGHTSIQVTMFLVMDGCEMVLLALDGVYLNKPREIKALEFLPSTRAEVAIKCPWSASGWKMVDPDTKDTVLTIEMGPNQADEGSLDISGWVWTPPKYLNDMRNIPADNYWKIEVDLHMPIINRAAFQGFNRSVALHEALFGGVEEWDFETAGHPMHVHINHMQLQDDMSDMFQAGDFIDTLKGHARIRMRMDTFDGVMMVHCHTVMHSDQGLMGIVFVTDQPAKMNPIAPVHDYLLIDEAIEIPVIGSQWVPPTKQGSLGISDQSSAETRMFTLAVAISIAFVIILY